jgi:predicted AAA+ superfamily ATPase
MSFWRTASGAEVDLILGEAEVAIEIKASEKAMDRTKGLHLFQEEQNCKKCYLVTKDPVPRKVNANLTVLPWQVFCKRLWDGEIN